MYTFRKWESKKRATRKIGERDCQFIGITRATVVVLLNENFIYMKITLKILNNLFITFIVLFLMVFTKGKEKNVFFYRFINSARKNKEMLLLDGVKCVVFMTIILLRNRTNFYYTSYEMIHSTTFVVIDVLSGFFFVCSSSSHIYMWRPSTFFDRCVKISCTCISHNKEKLHHSISNIEFH